MPATRLFTVAPITHNGLTVQPISLEQFSGQHPFATNFNEGAGARLIVRFSGLLSADALNYSSSFDTAYPNGFPSVTAGVHLTFAATVPSATAELSGSEHGNTEDIEILYWMPLHFTAASEPLTIDRILVHLIPTQYVAGPWSFDLPVS